MLLASQAASTAHELGSPLTTLKILTRELRLQAQDEQTQADLDLMHQQIELCKDKLKQLSQHQQLEQSSQQALTSVYSPCSGAMVANAPGGPICLANKPHH